jgi:hypothetical protein
MYEMRLNKQYAEAIEQAEANLADFRERGAGAIGESWDELRKELYTPEAIAASDLRVAEMIESTRAKKSAL